MPTIEKCEIIANFKKKRKEMRLLGTNQGLYSGLGRVGLFCGGLTAPVNAGCWRAEKSALAPEYKPWFVRVPAVIRYKPRFVLRVGSSWIVLWRVNSPCKGRVLACGKKRAGTGVQALVCSGSCGYYVQTKVCTPCWVELDCFVAG